MLQQLAADPKVRQFAANVGRRGAAATVAAIQRRRRRRGRRIIAPNLPARIRGGPGPSRTQTFQRSAAAMTVQTTQPGPLRVADTEQCAIPLAKTEDQEPTGFPLSPYEQIMWPKLAAKVSTYTYYRATRDIEIAWIPRVGTAVNGTIVMGFTPDVTTDHSGFESISALSCTVTTPVAQGAVLRIPCSQTNQSIYKRLALAATNEAVIGGEDAQSYLGVFYYAITGLTGNMTAGYFRVTYAFELTAAKYDDSPSAALVLDGGANMRVTRSPSIYTRSSAPGVLDIWSPSPVVLVQWILNGQAALAFTVDGEAAVWNLTTTGATHTIRFLQLSSGHHTVEPSHHASSVINVFRQRIW